MIDNLKHASVRNRITQEFQDKLKMEEIMYYSVDNYSIDNENIEKVNQLIEKLPAKCKEIFVAAYLENRRNKDIAAELNISVRTVDAQIYKALSFLRQNLFLSLFFTLSFISSFLSLFILKLI